MENVIRQISWDIAKFLLEMKNLNMNAKVSGIAWRKMIKDELPEDALWRLSMHTYDDEDEWKAEVQRAT